MLNQAFPACLAYGKVDGNSSFARFLQGMGVRGEEIAWFRRNAQAPDILGHNYYPIFMEEQSGPLENCLEGGVEVLKRRLRQAYAFYQLPLYLTETSAGTTPEEKLLWMEVDPANGSSSVPMSLNSITVFFTQAMGAVDKQSLYEIRNESSGKRLKIQSVTYNPANFSATIAFDTSKDWDPDSDYQVTFKL